MNNDIKKRCPKCNEWKEVTHENWYVTSLGVYKGRISSYCKTCARLARRLQGETQAKANRKHPPIIPDYKHCTKCKITQERRYFASNIRKKDGLSDHCFDCRQKYWAKYYRNGAQPTKRQQKEPLKAKRYNGPQPGFVYIIQLDCFFKIGISVNYKKRLAALNASIPYNVEIILTYKVRDMHWVERMLHRTFETKRLENKREWFRLSSNDIKLSKMILSDIASLTSSDVPSEGYTVQLTFDIGNTYEICET